MAFGVAAATAATKLKPKKPKPVSVTCSANTTIAIAANDTGVTPPVSQGNDYGTVTCGKLLGHGVQSDSFNVPDSGDNVASFWIYFPTGSIHGTYDLTPQEGSFSGTNFTETDYIGTATVAGGTGAFKGVHGTGDMTCVSLDAIHMSCTDKFKLKLKPIK